MRSTQQPSNRSAGKTVLVLTPHARMASGAKRVVEVEIPNYSHSVTLAVRRAMSDDSGLAINFAPDEAEQLALALLRRACSLEPER